MRNIVNFLMVFVAIFIVACGEKDAEYYKKNSKELSKGLGKCLTEELDKSKWTGECAKLRDIESAIAREKYERFKGNLDEVMEESREKSKKAKEQAQKELDELGEKILSK